MRLRVRANAQPTLSAKGRHAGNVALQRVEIDDEDRCLDPVERGTA
jgi:hypothetical protein